ncbi:DEAD/DEAH box helicase family protein [Sporosarcina gallistercoris]|uniref:DEAD/DEAH box helicase family protein n=1 Tax=Sporosarcina gallistercoris TaxID=2762245 RepID=A0ABR8PIW1_9BACL|nr:DEAD/DEAH box helicase family protein [Sporosarcina gallistercoris]MBD7908104.1 DEAD/DEAH box helicase family protein [Sporosarcina gallistercoris]
MNVFDKNITFCHPWRSYQARVLAELNEHLKNRHLHLVAPPGSGKTVLGLEVMLRLDAPTLIVAPTLAIRNQWIERFVESFLQEPVKPDWISTELRNPATVTVTTYQTLHSVLKGEDLETFFTAFDAVNFKTIILDEAHHLRTSWWQSAITFRDRLHEPNVVALTATPPYDAEQREWNNYIQLCGPIDEEIYVPELIREGDLCPHQDYVYASVPSPEEAGMIAQFHRSVDAFAEKLFANQEFLGLLEGHPWIRTPEENMDELLSSPAYYTSMMLFLRKAGSENWQRGLEIIGGDEKNIPEFSLIWLEELVNGLLYKDPHYDGDHPILKPVRLELSRIGAIERRTVMLRSSHAIQQTLVKSVTKLKSIEEIVSFETEHLGHSLRQVILADYIHKEDLPTTADDEKPLVRLGVAPIFERLRRKFGETARLGVLTGSLIIIPATAWPVLSELAMTRGVTLSSIPHAQDDGYLQIVVNSDRQLVTSLMTEVFSRGEIQVLIGTAALLGEGWDAPAINSLIIASTVGSYMLSNQMRGRAIRTQAGNPEKTAAIWHLVCVQPVMEGGGPDQIALERRFHSLIGLDAERPLIRSGIERLHLEKNPDSDNVVKLQNHKTLQRAANRTSLQERWQHAVETAERGERKEELTVERSKIPKPFIYAATVKSLVIVGAAVFFETAREVMGPNPFNISKERLLIALLVGIVIASPYLWKAGKAGVRHRSLERSMIQAATAVYESLFHAGLLSIPLSENRFRIEGGESVSCSLDQGTIHEQTIFLRAMQELLDPIENPRYLIVRRSKLLFVQRRDFHSVPEEIGRKKEVAENFLKQWNRHVDHATLTYTRTPEGRKELLVARLAAMSAIFQDKSERLSVWK